MKQQPDRDAAAVRIPPPIIPLLAILAGVGLEYLWPIDIDAMLPVPLRYWLGGAIVATAVLLGGWAATLMHKSGQNPAPWEPTNQILRLGPYRFTRNPMYLSMVAISLGVAIILANVWILLLTPLCAWTLQVTAIRPEEAYLERKFGDGYLSYKNRVRRWL